MLGRLKTILQAFIVLCVLALLWHLLREIGFRKIYDAVMSTDRSAVVAAFGLNVAAYVLWAARWQQLMKRGERHRLGAIFPIYMAGVFGNVVTPGARVGGEPIRAFYMSRAFGGEQTAHLGTILADKLSNAALFFVFLLISVTFVLIFVPINLAVKIVLESVVLLVFVAVIAGVLWRKHFAVRSPLVGKLLNFIYHSRPMEFITHRFPSFNHFEDYITHRLDNIVNPIGEAATNPRTLTKITVISILAWVLTYLANYVLFRALGVPVSFFAVFVIVNISTFLGDASVAPAGVGFTEITMIGLCAAFGIEKVAATTVTLISRGIFYFVGLGIGGLCLFVLSLIPARHHE